MIFCIILKAACYTVIFMLGLCQYVTGGFASNCHISGVQEMDWLFTSYKIDGPIEISFQGPIITLATKNIKHMEIDANAYVTATFRNDVLEISTTQNFKDNPKDVVSLPLNFNCSDGRTAKLTFKADITRNPMSHLLFNMERYDYKFVMKYIPKNFDLTSLLPIIATDTATSNKRVYFESESSSNFDVEYNAKLMDGNNEDDQLLKFCTKLKTTKKIEAPFEEQFIITAKKPGKPEKKVSAVIVVTLFSDHPHQIPVFQQNLYSVLYEINGTLDGAESIQLYQGMSNDTTIEVLGFRQYFEVAFKMVNNGTATISVSVKEPLPLTLLKNEDYINVDLKATNGDLVGKTTLLVWLPPKDKCKEVFEKPFYFGYYSDTKGLVVNQPISVNASVKVELLDYTAYFTVSIVDNLVIVKERFRPLPQALRANNEVPIRLHGKDSATGSSSITVILVQFRYYKMIGFLNDERHSNITLPITIGVIGVISVASNIIILKLYFRKK